MLEWLSGWVYTKMEVDGLPIWAKVGDLDITEEKLKEIESRGSHHDVMPEHSLLYTHRHFSFGFNGPHIVEVNMTSSDPQLVEAGKYVPIRLSIPLLCIDRLFSRSRPPGLPPPSITKIALTVIWNTISSNPKFIGSVSSIVS